MPRPLGWLAVEPEGREQGRVQAIDDLAVRLVAVRVDLVLEVLPDEVNDRRVQPLGRRHRAALSSA